MHLKILTNNATVSKYFQSTKNLPDDSGLDVIVPDDIVVPKRATGFKINLQMCVEPVFPDGKKRGFYLFPRSSISKTPLRLSNSIGIIDYGYRGNLIAAVDNVSDEDYKIVSGSRLFQICSNTLDPISFELIDELSQTERGEGGFGSTGV